jgi:hypothetical protein
LAAFPDTLSALTSVAISDLRGGPGGATGPTCAEAAWLVPKLLLAVTTTRIVAPWSAPVRAYEAAVAPPMFEHDVE